jgi:hypothetical protein
MNRTNRTTRAHTSGRDPLTHEHKRPRLDVSRRVHRGNRDGRHRRRRRRDPAVARGAGRDAGRTCRHVRLAVGPQGGPQRLSGRLDHGHRRAEGRGGRRRRLRLGGLRSRVQGVSLEGLEVAVIFVAFGAADHAIASATIGAVASVLSSAPSGPRATGSWRGFRGERCSCSSARCSPRSGRSGRAKAWAPVGPGVTSRCCGWAPSMSRPRSCPRGPDHADLHRACSVAPPGFFACRTLPLGTSTR